MVRSHQRANVVVIRDERRFHQMHAELLPHLSLREPPIADPGTDLLGDSLVNRFALENALDARPVQMGGDQRQAPRNAVRRRQHLVIARESEEHHVVEIGGDLLAWTVKTTRNPYCWERILC